MILYSIIIINIIFVGILLYLLLYNYSFIRNYFLCLLTIIISIDVLLFIILFRSGKLVTFFDRDLKKGDMLLTYPDDNWNNVSLNSDNVYTINQSEKRLSFTVDECNKTISFQLQDAINILDNHVILLQNDNVNYYFLLTNSVIIGNIKKFSYVLIN